MPTVEVHGATTELVQLDVEVSDEEFAAVRQGEWEAIETVEERAKDEGLGNAVVGSDSIEVHGIRDEEGEELLKEDEPAEKEIWLVVQQGGSSCEWYSCWYDTEDDAVAGIKGHKEATYNAIGPYKCEVPGPEKVNDDLLSEIIGPILAVIDDACGDACTENFADVEEVDA